MVPIAVKDNIICKALEEVNKTAGGIIIPETAQAQLPQKMAEVISFGGEVTSEIQVGDTVVIHQQAGQAMFIDGKVYLVLKDGEIYGVSERNEEVEVTDNI